MTQTQETPREEGNVTIEEREATAEDPGGTVTMSESVVATIAGVAAREIEGVYKLGRPRFVAFGESPGRGVAAEVGTAEAALDLDVVMEYGHDLRETAEKLRRVIAREVDRMCGRRVVEVNINVYDVHLPEREPPQPEPRSRVT